MDNVKLSIIIPTYNAEKTIFRLLDSLKHCNYKGIEHEVILVNNNCSDDTLLVAKQFNVKVIHEKRQGRSISRNYGASCASGEYLFFLDADVYVDNDYFQEVLKILKRKNIGGVQGRIIPSKVDGQHSINAYRYRSIELATKGTFCLLNLMVNESPMINSAACCYRADAFHLVGGFDEALERHEDIDLARRVSYSGYLLASAERAISYVTYHGEGWLSYFMRSYADGLTKIDYLRKWSRPIEYEGYESDESWIREQKVDSVEDKLPKAIESTTKEDDVRKPVKVNGPTLIYWAIKDLSVAFIKGIKQRDSYYFIDLINQVFRLFGRVVGLFRKPRHFGSLTIKLIEPQNRIKKVILGNGKVCILRPSFRFVLLLKNPYLIDINDHTIFSDDHNYPYFFSYSTLSSLGLFEEFANDCEQDSMIYQILLYKGLLASE